MFKDAFDEITKYSKNKFKDNKLIKQKKFNQNKTILNKQKNFSNKKHAWSLKDQDIYHRRLGKIKIDNLIPYKNYNILVLIPINTEYCFIVFTSEYKERKFLYMKDLNIAQKNNQITSFFLYKFFAPGHVMRLIRSSISSCKGESGTMSIGFLMRLFYKSGINSFSQMIKK